LFDHRNLGAAVRKMRKLAEAAKPPAAAAPISTGDTSAAVLNAPAC